MSYDIFGEKRVWWKTCFRKERGRKIWLQLPRYVTMWQEGAGPRIREWGKIILSKHLSERYGGGSQV